VLPGVVRHTFIIFGLFTTPNLCPPPTQNPGDATGHDGVVIDHVTLDRLRNYNTSLEGLAGVW